MSALYEIFEEYSRMRTNGMESKETLKTLRPYIESLSKPEREELAQHIRAWEAGENKSGPSPFMSDEQQNKASKIRPLSPRASPSIRDVVSQASIEPTWITCPHCGKKNRSDEVFCYSCGHMLEPSAGEYDTQVFAEADRALHGAGYFGPDSILLLEMRDLHQYFELRPQLRDHELIIGRSTDNSAMVPDVDLVDHKGADLGVSRLHTALKYDSEHAALQIYDLGSANGTFINGQKMLPKEVRVLRHGDEVRLGHFVLRAYFRHPGEEIR